MPRNDRPFPPRRPAPPSPTSDSLRRLSGWLWPRLAAAGRLCWARAVTFLESDEARLAATSLRQRIVNAIRWAWKNDTVPAGAARAAVLRHEERLARTEQRKALRAQNRHQREEKKRERERRYAEKSSIYLG